MKAVVSHENELKAQAKKMGVDSLKQKKEGEDSAEMKIAKVMFLLLDLTMLLLLKKSQR